MAFKSLFLWLQANEKSAQARGWFSVEVFDFCLFLNKDFSGFSLQVEGKSTW